MTHSSQRFCLRWNNHHSNLLSVFDQLLLKESFVDVTLAVEGQLLKAHKVILSACSPYFETLFVSHPDKHPIVILKDVPFADMRSLLDFIYRGEVSVDQDRLTGFLKVAESLRIKGLTEVNEEKCDLPSIASSLLSSNSQQATVPPPAVPPPPPSLHRIHLGQPSSSPSSLSSPNASTSSNKRCIPSPSNFQPFSAHGPPDLLEVNMTEHSQNSPSSFSEDQNIESPLPDDSCLETSEDCCVKTEPHDDLSVSGTSFTECRSPRTKDSPGSRSQSQTPTNASERYPPDLPLLRLVPKSELMAVFRKDSSHKGEAQNDDILTTSGHSNNTDIGDHRNSNNNNNNNVVNNNNNNNNDNYSSTSCNSGGGSNISNNNDNNGNINNNDNNINDNNNSGSNCTGGNNNNDSNHDNFLFNSASSHFMLNNETKFSPPPHLLSPRSNTSSTPGTPTADAASKTTATRRRVRRRATSSSDPAEQLTEMSVRGLNLFRYACIDDGVYKCLECAKTDIVKTFKNKYSFQRHAFLYHEGCQRKVFPCLVCSKEFSRPDKMKNHMKTVHDCFMPKECVVPKECLFPPPPPTIPFFLSPP